MHLLKCCINLLNYCESIDDFDLFNIENFKTKLTSDVNFSICRDTKKWLTDYVCLPSNFFERHRAVFNSIDRSLADSECDVIIKSQLDDGSFPITWLWHTDYKEFEVSKNWWKSILIINNMLYLKGLGRI